MLYFNTNVGATLTAQSFQQTLQVGHCLIAPGPANLSVGFSPLPQTTRIRKPRERGYYFFGPSEAKRQPSARRAGNEQGPQGRPDRGVTSRERAGLRLRLCPEPLKLSAAFDKDDVQVTQVLPQIGDAEAGEQLPQLLALLAVERPIREAAGTAGAAAEFQRRFDHRTLGARSLPHLRAKVRPGPVDGCDFLLRRPIVGGLQ